MKSKVVTALILFVIGCLSILSVSSCSSKKYDVSYLTTSNIIVENNDITLITSQTELEAYKIAPRFMEAGTDFVEKLDSYSSDFFESKMLIVINLQEETSSSKITVEEVDVIDSEVHVILKRKVPTIGADDIKTWSIFIEMDIQEVESVKYSFQ